MLFIYCSFRYTVSTHNYGFRDLNNLLKSIFGAIHKITDEEKAKSMLTNELAFRLDNVTVRYSLKFTIRDYELVYKSFRLKFGLDVKPRKQMNI